jgi:hypothetical protein
MIQFAVDSDDRLVQWTGQELNEETPISPRQFILVYRLIVPRPVRILFLQCKLSSRSLGSAYLSSR